MSNPCGYTTALALEDFVPVVLSGIGCYLLARTAWSRVPSVRVPAILGVIFIVLGGLSKAGWKLRYSTFDVDPAWMERSLFLWLGTGFTLLAWALLTGLKQRRVAWWPFAAWWAVVVVGTVALAAGADNSNWAERAARCDREMVWTKPFFFTTIIMSLAVSAYAIRLAQQAGDRWAIALFVVQIVGVFALVPIQNVEEQTLSLQWLEECINTVAQGAFALGAWRVWRALSARAAVPAGPPPAHPTEGNRS